MIVLTRRFNRHSRRHIQSDPQSDASVSLETGLSPNSNRQGLSPLVSIRTTAFHYNIDVLSKSMTRFDDRLMKHRLLKPIYRELLLALSLACWLGGNAAAQEEVDNASARAFNSAAALQNAGLHKRASTKWTEFIAQYPKDDRVGRAHYYLGVCQLRVGKFADAAQAFQNVLHRWPNLAQADRAQHNLAMAHYEIATADKNADRFRQAALDFGVVASKYPNSDLVDSSIYYQADCLYHAGDLPGAVQVYQKLITQHPKSTHAARAFYDLGIAQQELGQTAEAAKTFASFLAKADYSKHELVPEIRLRLAICWHDTNDLEQAAEQFSKAAEIPNFELAPYAALRLGQTKLDQQRYDEAATLLNRFSKKYRNSEYLAEAMKTAGQCYYMADKPRDAIRVLTRVASSKDPPAAEAAYWLGRSQLKLKQNEQALKTLENAIGRFGDHPFANYLKFARIDALYELPKRRSETPALYETFWRENPKHALASRAAYMTALSSFGQQQYSKAREVAEAFLAIPANEASLETPDMRFIAAESYLLGEPDNANDRSKAEALYRKLVTKHPEHARAPQSLLRIGWCLYADDRPQEAIKHLNGALEKFDKQQQLPEARLLIGRSHAQLNQHREAIKELSATLKADGSWPRIDEVLFSLADSHRALGEHDPAAELLRRLVNSQPKSPLRSQSLYWLGEIAQQKKQQDEAIKWFQQVVQHHSDSEFSRPAMHALAAIHFAKQQYPQTRDWASRLVDGKPADQLNQRGRYLRGLAFHREHEFSKAVDDLTAYRQQAVDPDEAINANYTLVLCHIGLKQFDQARNLLTELVKNNPDFPHADSAFYELGHGLRSVQDKAAEAAEAFEWVAVKRPSSELAPESWFRVAQYHVDRAGKLNDDAKQAAYEKAETSLKNGLATAKAASMRENMLYLSGDLQFQQQRFEDAAKTLTTQVAEFPNGTYVGDATFLAAQSKYRLEQFDQALPLFVKVTELAFAETSQEQMDSYRSQALYLAGDCAAKLSRWTESQSLFQKLVDQYPKFSQLAEATYGIGYALHKQNQSDAAMKVFDQVTLQTETETAAKARFMIGEIEFGLKKYEDAIEQFLVVTVGYPYESWQALARFETARCFRELGDPDRAAQTLREMIEKHPSHGRIPDARRMLEELKQ